MSQLQQVAAAMAAALAAGTLLLVVLSMISATAERTRALWPLMRTEILIVASAVAIFLAGTPAIGLALVLVACRVGFESANVWAVASLPAPERWRFGWTAGLGLAITTAAVLVVPFPFNIIAALCLLGMLFISVGVGLKRPWDWRRLSLLARVVAYPGLPLCALALAVREPQCHAALLLAFLLTELFDSFAVLGGRLFGQRKLFPRLSPHKTVAGLMSGLAVLALAGLLLTALADISVAMCLIAPGATAAGATAGDLLGSAAKRAAGVKDYPAILREQGGLLDILDAWLITGPLLAGLWLVIG